MAAAIDGGARTKSHMAQGSVAANLKHSPVRLVVVGAMALSLGLGLFQALVAAPWLASDERAHTGYVMALAGGRLPTITTPIEVPPDADDLASLLAIQRAAQLSEGNTSRDTVWVANHPPGPYLLALPGTWIAEATGRGYQVLWWLRVVNVVGGALAVGFTALLARELSGSRWAGAGAAVLCASNPYLSRASSLAMTDGMTLAVMVAVMWAAVLAERRSFDRGSTVVLATAAVACGFTRLTSLVTAMVVVALALAFTSWRDRRLRWRPALAVAVPVAALTGWFYALNVWRYGDPAASDELLDRFERSPVGSVLDVALDPSQLLATLRTLAVARVDRSFSQPELSPWPDPTFSGNLVLLGVAASVAVLAVGAVRRRRRPSPTPATAPRGVAPPTCSARIAVLTTTARGWIIVVAALVANWLMMAQHVSGGGMPHSRYLLVAVPVAAIVVATAVRRLAPRSPLAVVAVGLALTVHNLNGLDEVKDRSGRAGAYEKVALGPDWSHPVALALVAVAVAVVVAGVVRDRGRHRRYSL